MDALICPDCGAANPVEAQVCEQCNADLSAVKSVIDSANSHYNEALALAHGGKLDEALGRLEAALALNTENPQYHNLLGTIQAQKGLYSEAMRAWERTLALDPEAEKAFKNIEKARGMEAEAAEEERRRPLKLTAIGAVAAAVFFFLITCYFGVRLWTKNRMIDDYVEQVTLAKETQDALNTQLVQVQAKLDAINDKFPEGGLEAMLQKQTQLETLADTRQSQLERITELRNKERDSFREELTKTQNENAALQREVQKINALQAEVNARDAKIQSIEKQLADAQQTIQLTQGQLQNYKDLVAQSEQNVKQIQQNSETQVQSIRDSYDQNIEALRDENRKLRDEIASMQRTIDDAAYANGLVVEAVKNIEANKFELAMQNIESALARAPEHGAALYLQSELKDILSDPLEQEIRREEAQNRAEQRVEKRHDYAVKNMGQANDLFRKGSFDDAIEHAERVKQLASEDSSLTRDADRLISQAQEQKRKIALMLLTVKDDISKNNYEEARRELDRVLKISPDHPEANELQDKISEASQS